MPGYYTVKQGDHISSIAKAYGFTDWETIWNDGNNAGLKQLRKNPNVLYPGDQVYIPEKELRVEPRPTEKRHKFLKHKQPLKLRLVLEDLYEKPIANADCELTLDGTTYHVTTDGDGHRAAYQARGQNRHNHHPRSADAVSERRAADQDRLSGSC